MTEPKLITQKRIADAIERSEQAKNLKAALRRDLLAGAQVEGGPHVARLIDVETKRPNWRGFILRKHGKRCVKRIIAATPTVEYQKMELR